MMSRTYRNKYQKNGRCTIADFFDHGHALSKKDIAEYKRDGKHYENIGWFFNFLTRTRRANDRNEISKVKLYIDYDDFVFNDDKYRVESRAIWWHIN